MFQQNASFSASIMFNMGWQNETQRRWNRYNWCMQHLRLTNSVSGKVLCLQMSHVSLVIWTTNVLRCGDVEVNIMRIVAYGRLHVWWGDMVGGGGRGAGVQARWYVVVFRCVIWHLWLLTGIWLLDAILTMCCSQVLCHSSEITLYQQDTTRPHSFALLRNKCFPWREDLVSERRHKQFWQSWRPLNCTHSAKASL